MFKQGFRYERRLSWSSYLQWSINNRYNPQTTIACFHGLYRENFDLSSRTGLSVGYQETKILHYCGAFLCQTPKATPNTTTCHTPKRVKRWKVLLLYSGTFCLTTVEIRKKNNITCTSLAFKKKQCRHLFLLIILNNVLYGETEFSAPKAKSIVARSRLTC